MAKKSKIKKNINQEELPDFLRKIADALENGAPESDAYLVVIEGFKKLKISIRNDFGHSTVKVTAKPMDQECPSEVGAYESGEEPSIQEEDTSIDKPSFKSVKKRMRSSFKAIFKSIHAGEMPPPEAVAEFIADSHLMVSYEGYGDEYYEEYINACDAFEEALKNDDLEAAHKACDNLNSIKAHCHSEHK